jgi:4-amino-4-deoxy-L-arabinose transferase-like glycosyltransferase
LRLVALGQTKMGSRFQNHFTQPSMMHASYEWARADIILFVGLVCLLIARLVALYITPLELGVDEAQYWVWSQDLSFGYYSKPPLIAWIIGISHALFGHSSFGVRVFAPIIQFIITLILWRCAYRLYDDNPRAGKIARIAALLWALMPAVSLGSAVISTDTPMLLFWCIALYLLLPSNSVTHLSSRKFLLAGLVVGFAMLSKYAGAYFLLCSAIWLVTGHVSSYSKRFVCLLTLLSGSLLVMMPNLIWNLENGLVTIIHLSENANLSLPSYSLAGVIDFWQAQIFVFGPLSLVCFFAAIFRWQKHSLFLLIFCLPVLVIISIQAYLKEANANWAIAAYPAATLLVAGWLGNFSRQTLSHATIFINALIGIIIISVTVTGQLGSLTPESDPLRRVRGWQALSADLEKQIEINNARTIIADRRATAAILKWYFYKDPVQITVYDSDNHPGNHFELKFSYNAVSPSPIIALSQTQRIPSIAGVEWTGLAGTSNHKIAKNRYRKYYFYLGENALNK